MSPDCPPPRPSTALIHSPRSAPTTPLASPLSRRRTTAMPRNNKKPVARKSSDASAGAAPTKAAAAEPAVAVAAAPTEAVAATAAAPAKATDSSPNHERSFIMIKPDGVHRALVGNILRRFEDRGYKLVALKQVTASREHLEEHYCDLKDKPFFPSLIAYMESGPVVAMVWQGLDIVKQGRAMLGATNPLASAPGSIRGDFSIQTGRNICHGSDSVDSAAREIAHWFGADEINDYESPFIDAWVYE